MVVNGKAATRAPSSSEVGAVTALKKELCKKYHPSRHLLLLLAKEKTTWKETTAETIKTAPTPLSSKLG
jgi:hypothetical protein